MDQKARRLFLIRELLKEQPQYQEIALPASGTEQRRLLRSLFNVRPPGEIGSDFLSVQDAYLREENERKGITDWKDLTPVRPVTRLSTPPTAA